MTKTICLILTGLLFLASSCKTYTIPVNDFKQQYAGLGNSHSRLVTVQGPGGKWDSM